MTLTIGFDIGGTKMAGGVVDADGEVLAATRRRTPAADAAEMCRAIIEVASELARAHPVEAIGIGAAGWIDTDGSTVLFAPNIAWRNEPLRAEVADAMGLPVVVENDASVAAWGEFRYGAARDADDSMVMLTVGTGVGGGIIFGGELWRGAHGIAGELGHMLAVPDGHPCGCGRSGCLEQYASGNALVRFAQVGARRQPARAAGLLERAGGDAGAITGPMVGRAAQDGDEVARFAFAELGKWLGMALADLAQILDPQVFVVGGGVMAGGDLLLGPTRQAYLESLRRRSWLPVADVRAAELGNTAGMVGAADLARRR